MPWLHNNISDWQKVLLLILGAVIVAVYAFFDPTSIDLFPKCPLYATTGLYCPGCGSQRAAHSFLNGDVISGFKYNWLIALLFIILCYMLIIEIAQRFFNYRVHNMLHQSIVTKGILIFVLLFWIMRNIPLYPFNMLAP